MTPDISEFTYGFALTNELVGWMALSSVPIFPSLIEEGKASGGYDVKLDRPGVPLFLQFKRSHVMKRRSANEIKNLGLTLEVPFHRFAITERKRSLQHTSLVTLDNGINEVYYVAPIFHTLDGINEAWSNNRVAQRSIFVSPAEIGIIADDLRHTVSFDENVAYFCSEPRAVAAVSIELLKNRLTNKLKDDDRPVRAKLDEWIESATDAAVQSQEIQLKMEDQFALSDARNPELTSRQVISARPARPLGIRQTSDRVPSMPVREAKQLQADHEKLRRLAKTAQAEFNAQLIIIQEN